MSAWPLGAQAASLAPPSKQVATINLGTFPTTLDPSKARSESDRIVANALFAPLYRSTGTAGTLLPFLATGQPVASQGGRRYTVTLRAAKWSDGTPIGARDVKYAFDRAKILSPIGKLAASDATATVVGPRTIRFDLSAASPWFAEVLASTATTPVPAQVVKRFGDTWTTPKNIATSGPFRLFATSGHSEAVLVPNPSWWGRSSVRLRTLRLVVATPASGTQLFRAGRIDAGMRDTSVPASLMTSMRANAGFRTTTSGTAWYLFQNTTSVALQSSAVRRGVALAIDRASLAASTSGGFDMPLETIVPSSARGFATIAAEGELLLPSSGAPQVSRATAELTAGGWSKTTKLDLWYDGTSAPVVAMASTIVGNLGDVGVPVTPHPVTPQMLDRVGTGTSPIGSDVELVLRSVHADRADPSFWHSMFTCPAVTLGRNPSNFCLAGADGAIDLASTSSPFATRAAIHHNVELEFTGTSGAMPAVPLVEPVGEYLVQKWVRNFSIRSTGLVDFERVYLLDH